MTRRTNPSNQANQGGKGVVGNGVEERSGGCGLRAAGMGTWCLLRWVKHRDVVIVHGYPS